MLYSIKYRLKAWYYDHVRTIFKPQHSRLRKAIPKTWCDIASLITNVNFEFVKSFYEEEFINGFIDWEATESHKEFSEWLKSAYLYIVDERPELQKLRDNSYPNVGDNFFDCFQEIIDNNGRKMLQFKDDGIPYEVKYAEVIRLEKLIEEKDTELLTQIVKRREMFWT